MYSGHKIKPFKSQAPVGEFLEDHPLGAAEKSDNDKTIKSCIYDVKLIQSYLWKTILKILSSHGYISYSLH